MTASDVAFTFNLLMKNSRCASQAPAPTPLPVSATAPSATTAVLNFAQPEYANLFLIGQVYIVPAARLAERVSNPATYADASPVGTGPYMLAKFSPQKVHAQAEPVLLAEVQGARARGRLPGLREQHHRQPGAAGQRRRSTSPATTWPTSSPTTCPRARITTPGRPTAVVRRQQRGDAVAEHHQGAAERPGGPPGDQRRDRPAAARRPRARPATSRRPRRPAGCCCRPRAPCSTRPGQRHSRPPATRPRSAQLLSSDGYTKTGGKWTKNGQPITFSIEDPIPTPTTPPTPS